MSLHLEFEPNGWYYGFAIERPTTWGADIWHAYIDDGNTYQVVTLEAKNLKQLRAKIRAYHSRDDFKHAPARYVNILRKGVRQ